MFCFLTRLLLFFLFLCFLPAQNEIQPQGGAPPRPVATPPEITVPRGSPARFHCDPGSDSPADVHWSFGPNNGPLRGDVFQEGNDLVISSANDDNAGEYICTATNPHGTGTADPVKLIVSDSESSYPFVVSFVNLCFLFLISLKLKV